MTAQQWYWQIAAHVPLPAWGLSVILLLGSVGWVLQGGEDRNLERVRQQILQANAAIADLTGELEGFQESHASEAFANQDTESTLNLVLRHRCGLVRGFRFSHVDGVLALGFNGELLEALCVLRALRKIPGGLSQFRRQDGNKVELSWQGTRQ